VLVQKIWTDGLSRRYVIQEMENIVFAAFNKMKTAIGLTGLPLVVSRFASCTKVPLLCYHNPNPSFFESHVSWLRRHYDPIPFALFIKAVTERDRSILPPRPLVVTIDDGWQANIELIPVLVKYSFPILIYLTAGMIGTSRKFWWLAVKQKGGNPQPLKRLPFHEFLKVLHDRFAYEPEKEYPERCALSWDEVYHLRKTGLVEFGSHSITHPILTNCPDDLAWQEIDESKRMIECKLDESIIHFAYPNGDHSAREKEMVKAAGYATGRTVREGWVNINAATDPYDLAVLRQPDNDNIPQLSYALAGFDVLRKCLVKGYN